MDNCLVTQLKGAVENSGLVRIGEIKLFVPTGVDTYIGANVRHIVASDPAELISEIDMSRTDGGETVGKILQLEKRTGTNISKYWINNNSGHDSYIKLYHKYDLTDLSLNNLILADKMSLNNILFLFGNNIVNFCNLCTANDAIYGDISAFENVDVSVVRALELENAGITGNIESFSLSSKYITELWLRKTSVHGSLNPLIDGLAAGDRGTNINPLTIYGNGIITITVEGSTTTVNGRLRIRFSEHTWSVY